ncbi:hypothetical protein VKT23_009255 [Stygiomarasmius scandens]|uniref:Spherulin 4 n=1 Tax=Marasmiellus scandens TaxID=2682957 RepID=A0ABR1JHF7_9AGAR
MQFKFLSALVSTLLVYHSTGVSAQLTTGAIFPLYINPGGTSCSGWSEIIDSISANPTLPFYLIVNPNSGPVANPDSGYQTCIPRVRSLSDNVRVVGYVATGNGNKSPDAVANEVETYMGWGAAYRPTGIFFDEVSATTGNVQLYSSYASQVRQDFGSDSFVILNPGVPVSVDDYFDFADLIITTENFYNDFNPSSLQISATKPASKQAVLLHTGPQSLPTSLIDQLTGLGIGALFITNMDQADAYDTVPSYWSEFCAELVSSQT